MKRRQIIILILLLVIGFASVTTTLVLNGNVGVGVELDDFDVIFIEALLDGKEDTKATISEDKKTITFSTDKLSDLGDSARLDYKVKNTSTQYDADVRINCTNEASEYITVTSSFDGNTVPLDNSVNIKAQEVKNGYINAELTKAYPGDDTSIEISCKIIFTASSRETYAYSLNFNSNGGSKVDDKSVILNDNYGELETPTREGYTFLGWYDEDDNKVDENTILDTKGNRKLQAKWEETVYDLNIVTIKDGVSKTNIIGITYGNKLEISINEKNYYISSIKCSEGYTIEDYDLVIPTYGEQKPNIKNNKVEKNGTCTFTLEKGIFEFDYTGNAQTFTAPITGSYKVELWGAQGGNTAFNGIGGKGAYTSGAIYFQLNQTIFIYVGGKGPNGTMPSSAGGFNGGGGNTTTDKRGSGGGGATDIRLVNGIWNNINSLRSRIMVAGAGGGGGISNTGAYGNMTGNKWSSLYGGNGTQTSGGEVGTGYTHDSEATRGGFGYGGNGGNFVVGAGGSGYYGGAGGQHITTSTSGGGGGGSSFISGHSGCNAINSSGTHTGQPNHYSGYIFTNTKMIAGNATMPNHAGTGTMTGNSGNGYAKITLISID